MKKLYIFSRSLAILRVMYYDNAVTDITHTELS